MIVNWTSKGHTVQQLRNRSFFSFHACALMKKLREVQYILE
jgi:hypothetical protein